MKPLWEVKSSEQQTSLLSSLFHTLCFTLNHTFSRLQYIWLSLACNHFGPHGMSQQAFPYPQDHARCASTRHWVSSPIAVHVHFQLRIAGLLRGRPQCFSWHSLQLPRHSFQLRHVSCIRSRECLRKTLDCFRDVHAILRLARTSHGSTPKFCRLLFCEVWTVLNCFCIGCPQLHPRSLDHVASNEFGIFHQLRNTGLSGFPSFHC